MFFVDYVHTLQKILALQCSMATLMLRKQLSYTNLNFQTRGGQQYGKTYLVYPACNEGGQKHFQQHDDDGDMSSKNFRNKA